jgi:hypothetical protein
VRFTAAFSDELTKLAEVYSDPAEGVQDVMNSTQGRYKKLPGKLPASYQQQTAQSVPAPETSPPSMQAY